MRRPILIPLTLVGASSLACVSSRPFPTYAPPAPSPDQQPIALHRAQASYCAEVSTYRHESATRSQTFGDIVGAVSLATLAGGIGLLVDSTSSGESATTSDHRAVAGTALVASGIVGGIVTTIALARGHHLEGQANDAMRTSEALSEDKPESMHDCIGLTHEEELERIRSGPQPATTKLERRHRNQIATSASRSSSDFP